jgi:hypothetical protein
MARRALKKKARISSKRLINVPHEVRPAAMPFEKYRGIGNPGIRSGRKTIVRIIRQLRGR